MSLQPDIAAIDERQAVKIGERIRAAKTIGEGDGVAAAMSALVGRQHDIASAGIFSCKVGLHLRAVEITMDGKDGRCGLRTCRCARPEQQCSHLRAACAPEMDLRNSHAVAGLDR